MKFDYKKKQLESFFYWINERHSVYLKRKAGEPWPWTKDKILQTYKFTNPFRQLDRVTQEWTNRWIRLLCRGDKSTRYPKGMMDGDILFHACMFRFFNWPETYDALYYGMRRWDVKRAIEILRKRKEEDHEQIFTGAYIITAAGRKDPKYEVICEALEFLYQKREDFAARITRGKRIETAVDILMEVPTQGPFTSYEVVCDLRHTRLLADARDVNSWANPGPGAKRGIHRLLSGKKDWPGKKPDYIPIMYDLLTKAKAGSVSREVLNAEWPFEMREIEQSLCEVDKYLRIKSGEGRTRSMFKPRLDDDGIEIKSKGLLPWEDE